MGLFSLIEQRKIGPVHGSESSLIPLKTPSGPQYTEAEMETELIEQLAFCPQVTDILTQPVIRYFSRGKERRYTGDVLFEVSPGSGDQWRYYFVEVKPQRYLAEFRTEGADKIAAAKAWCARQGAAFRIMSERDIRTPLLQNTRLLSTARGALPNSDQLQVIHQFIGDRSVRIKDLLSMCKTIGIREPDARITIESAVANRSLRCDLTVPFTDQTKIWHQAAEQPATTDPILGLVQVADSS